MVGKGLSVKGGADMRKCGLKERRSFLKRRKVGREGLELLMYLYSCRWEV